MSALESMAPIWAPVLSHIRGLRESAPGEPELMIDASSVLEVLSHLKNNSTAAFEHLADLTAYDASPKSPRFVVVYELISMRLKKRLSVIAAAPSDTSPEVPSIVDLWAGASWLEREVFDMFGIRFSRHPDLRRILMPEVFVGHPLRKDFVVDFRQKFKEPSSTEQVFDPFGNTIIQVNEKE